MFKHFVLLIANKNLFNIGKANHLAGVRQNRRIQAVDQRIFHIFEDNGVTLVGL